MKQNLRLFMLTLLCAVFSSAWGQETIASGTFDGKNGNYTTGWTTTGTGTTRNDCIVIYEGENIGEGCKSIALRITYQANDRTLKEEEVSSVHSAILEGLSAKLNAQLRG